MSEQRTTTGSLGGRCASGDRDRGDGRDRPVGGLVATTLTLVVVNTVDIEGISLMGSAGFLIIFAAVNLAARRLLAGTRLQVAAEIAGALACVGCLVALISYAATHIPGQLAVLGGLLGASILGERIIRRRRATKATKPDPTGSL